MSVMIRAYKNHSLRLIICISLQDYYIQTVRDFTTRTYLAQMAIIGFANSTAVRTVHSELVNRAVKINARVNNNTKLIIIPYQGRIICTWRLGERRVG